MSEVDKAWETQIANIQKKTGKSLTELSAIIKGSGLAKHGELRRLAMDSLGLGYGDANALVHYVLQSDGARAAAAGATPDEVLDGIYAGPKAALRPIHDRLMATIGGFGEFEIVPKKGYVSLRRKKQFATMGPATNARVDVGLNMKGIEPGERLLAEPAGAMCHYKVKVTGAEQVDDELVAWVKAAYDAAG